MDQTTLFQSLGGKFLLSRRSESPKPESTRTRLADAKGRLVRPRFAFPCLLCLLFFSASLPFLFFLFFYFLFLVRDETPSLSRFLVFRLMNESCGF